MRILLAALVMLAIPVAVPVLAQTTIKVGVIAEMTGQQAEYGLQITNGMKLYMHQHGETVAGHRIELVIKDVGGPQPERAKRLAQDLVVNDHVDFLAGFGFSPNAMAVAPVATEAKIPMVVMNAATSLLTTRSPYIVRTSMTIAQNAMVIADWAAKNGIKRVYVLHADYGPGKDGAEQFKKTFNAAGGEIAGEVAVPLNTVEFGPYLQRIRDAKPDAAFVWVPSGELANSLIKGYRERALDSIGIRMIATSDAVDDMFLNGLGEAALGLITAGHYSVAHESAANKTFVEGYEKLFGSAIRPNFMAVGGYDGMAAIYEVVRRLNGRIDGTKAMEVLKGLKIDSPRGPIAIDPETRDIIQTIYIRRVERRGNDFFNIEFARVPNVKDPGK